MNYREKARLKKLELYLSKVFIVVVTIDAFLEGWTP